MGDIVETLRAYGGNDDRDYRHRAADEITSLRSENAAIRNAALEEAANLADWLDPNAVEIAAAIRKLKESP